MRGIVTALGLAAALAVAPAASARMSPLHAVRGANPRIEDAGGRQVLLRGANSNQLGDYYRANPAIAPVAPLSERDFASMARLGFSTVRLLVSWSSIEPARGRIDEAYLGRVKQAVGWARRHRIYVVLDMHQDAWGKYIATPRGEACPPGTTPNQGWDGAPQWATLTDGLSTCRIGIREVAPAVGQAWQSFWDDRDGIQAEQVSAWAAVARKFAADPAVAGYDLLNEPNPGLAAGAGDSAELAGFYSRAIGAIRAAERSVHGGFAHVVFFEPGAIWSAGAVDAVPPPGFSDDPQLVFAPHLYAESIALAPATIEQGFDAADKAASGYQSTFWAGEWGWFGDPKQDREKILRYAREEDAYRVGGTWWQWKQACGDPHDFSDGADATPGPTSGNLYVFACPSMAPLPRPAGTLAILSRATVRAAPGLLTSLASDPDTRSFSAAGDGSSARGSCTLEAWVPGTARPRFGTTGLTRLRARRVSGGWRVTACARGRYSLRLLKRT